MGSDPSGCVLVENKRQAEKLSSEYGDGTYQPLYTFQPKREPLSKSDLGIFIGEFITMPILDDADLEMFVKQYQERIEQISARLESQTNT